MIVQALRVSMEEQRARQEDEAKKVAAASAAEAGVTIPEGNNGRGFDCWLFSMCALPTLCNIVIWILTITSIMFLIVTSAINKYQQVRWSLTDEMTQICKNLHD